MPKSAMIRRRRLLDDCRGKSSASSNMILIMAAILSILRSTADAFQSPSVGMQTRTCEFVASSKRRKSKGWVASIGTSSLHVLSSPRRRTSSTSSSNIPYPIINFQGKNPLLIDVQKTAIGWDEPSTLSVSTQAVQIPVVSKIAAALQPLIDTEKKKASHYERISGTASTSTLFRAKNMHAMVYPSPSAISKETMDEARTRKRQSVTEVKTVEELDRFWPESSDYEKGRGEECSLDDVDDDCIDYPNLLRSISVEGDTQRIGSRDHLDFVHPVVKLMHERKREGKQGAVQNRRMNSSSSSSNGKKEKIALVVEGGGMRGCVSAGMACAIHCLGLSDTIDVVYGSSAGAVISAYFVSKQLPYFGLEVYYDALTTMDNNHSCKTSLKNAVAQRKESIGENDQVDNSNDRDANDLHTIDRYRNNYFLDPKRMTRSLGLGLCDPRLLKDVWTRPLHGKPMMNLHYMFESVMQKRKPLDYETFIERQKIQPLKVVATGLVSEKPFILSQEKGHFDTFDDLCHSLHASCLLPGIAGPVMNVLKKKSDCDDDRQKPNFFLRNMQRRSIRNDDYEPLADAMLSAPIPYDIAHEEGATHVLVIRSSPDGTNLLEIPSIVAWMGSRIYKRFFLKKNHLPGMYKRSQTEQRHQRTYAKTILELNERANNPQKDQDKTMTIALEPGSDEVSHLETTREGIFRGVRLGFARAYDTLVEDPELRGKGKEMAMRIFPDEILDYDPNQYASPTQSSFEQYLESSGIMPKLWTKEKGPPML